MANLMVERSLNIRYFVKAGFRIRPFRKMPPPPSCKLDYEQVVTEVARD
jgi:hypothetical protein